MTPHDRRPRFRRNERLEELLRELNGLLGPAESELVSRLGQPELPIILVVGPPRSGTTLLLQWLAASGAIACPTNLLSRFYGAPAVGAKIQLLLTDPRYDFRGELAGLATGASFDSENGKTSGPLSPNEFWYFWRRFLPDPARDDHSDDELRAGMDHRALVAELAGLVRVLERPFAAKAMLFNHNIPYLDEILDKVVFVATRRDPVTNTASLLRARERQLGSVESWYSFRFPGHEALSALPPVEQVAAQIACNHRAVDRGLERVDPSRWLRVDYEDFCARPESVWSELVERLAAQGHRMDSPYQGPSSFRVSTDSQLSPDDRERALAAYREHLDRAPA